MKATRIINERLYREGSEVSFPKSIATQLIEQGFAEEIKRTKKEVGING